MFKDDYRSDNEQITPDDSLIKYLSYQMNKMDQSEVKIQDISAPAVHRPKRSWLRAAIATAACLAIAVSAGGLYIYHGGRSLEADTGSMPQDSSVVVKGEVKTNVSYAEIYAIIKAMEAKQSANDYAGTPEIAEDGNANAGGSPSPINGTPKTTAKGAATQQATAGTNATKPASQDSAGSGNKRDYSETNTQVNNVDEADIVKTDGEYIYRLNNQNKLFIVRAQKGQMQTVAKIDCTTYSGKDYRTYPIEMYVKGDRLVILQNLMSTVTQGTGTWAEGAKVAYDSGRAYDMIYPSYDNATCAAVYDIADRAHPKLITDPGQSGQYLSSRMVDNVLYLITNYNLYGKADEKDPITFVPVVYDSGIKTPLAPQNIVVSAQPQGRQYLVVTALDVADSAKRLSSQTVLGCGSTMFASTENLLIASSVSSVIDEKSTVVTSGVTKATVATSAAREPGQEIAPTPADAAPDYAGAGVAGKPVAGVTGNSAAAEADGQAATTTTYQTVTNLIRFSMNKGELKLEATGKVPGSLLNQFSMDEYEDTFRLVTTTESYAQTTVGTGNNATVSWGQSQGTSNALYTLNSKLEILGRIEDVAKGERVYSVRFDGKIGYFVTFRQVDPLFAVDLSNPAAPKILSALKIPGFSEYLHPYSDGLLFGLGKDADENTGRVNGMKLSMFDVSDPAKVTEKQKLSLPYYWSDASYNHKAILVSPGRGLIAFAADNKYVIYSYNKDKGFAKVAVIQTEEYVYDQRGLYIDDVFYVTSHTTIYAYSMSDYRLISSLRLS